MISDFSGIEKIFFVPKIFDKIIYQFSDSRRIDYVIKN